MRFFIFFEPLIAPLLLSLALSSLLERRNVFASWFQQSASLSEKGN